MRLAAVVITSWLAVPGAAQGQLVDPTRPPPAVLAGLAKDAPKAAAPSRTALTEDTTLKLQMLNPSQQYAVINGKAVRLGGMVEGAKLVEIRNDGVVLQSPEGVKETISLYPGVRIRLVNGPQAGDVPKGKVREGAPSDAPAILRRR